MKKNLLLIGLAVLMAIPLSANANDYKIVSENRKVSAFDAIYVSGRFKITLFESSQSKVTVIAADEFMTNIETNVTNGTLKINTTPLSKNENKNFFESLKAKFNDYLSSEIIEVRIGVNNLKELNISGVSTYESETVLNSKTLYINASNASRGDLKVNVSDKLSVALSGAAKLELEGNADKAQIDASGASNLDGEDLTTKDTTVKQSGASRVEIVATESIDANLSGATKLVCKGSPKSVKQSVARGSSITIK